jgi:hypothetical protein
MSGRGTRKNNALNTDPKTAEERGNNIITRNNPTTKNDDTSNYITKSVVSKERPEESNESDELKGPEKLNDDLVKNIRTKILNKGELSDEEKKYIEKLKESVKKFSNKDDGIFITRYNRDDLITIYELATLSPPEKMEETKDVPLEELYTNILRAPSFFSSDGVKMEGVKMENIYNEKNNIEYVLTPQAREKLNKMPNAKTSKNNPHLTKGFFVDGPMSGGRKSLKRGNKKNRKSARKQKMRYLSKKRK